MVLCGKYHAKFLQIPISSQNLKTLNEVGMFQIFTEPGDRAGNRTASAFCGAYFPMEFAKITYIIHYHFRFIHHFM